MKKSRVYVDTSVFGGCFDKEFAAESRRLFEHIQAKELTLVLSATTLRELDGAPAHLQELAGSLADSGLEIVELSEEVGELRDAYVDAGVASESSLSDAEHIACASVAGVDLVVSWNFRHIVNYQRIRGYHAVNIERGYPMIPIYSPKEVVES